MRTTTIALTLLLVACAPIAQTEAGEPIAFTEEKMESQTRLATFAGGCFWCMEPPFEKLDGVRRVTSGYAGGSELDPSYKQVSAGATGHLESVQVEYDPGKVSYETLLETFWQNIDPTDAGGQFVDRGKQYRSAIFYHDEEQRALAEASKAEIGKRFEEPIVTEVREYTGFYPAEEYHQDYYKKNPARYKFYRGGSGRDQFLNSTWDGEKLDLDLSDVDVKAEREPWEGFDKPSEEDLKEMLTPLQYDVTQEEGTERPFQNEYWDEKRDGIYVDVLSGEPLFSSKDKYDSGTGWPSFTRPLEPGNIVTREDRKLFSSRTEVRSRNADSHLGHVFTDGPKEEGGLRYCMNSAALRFISKERLEEEGYGEYLKLFEN